jgi:hypothetical protein
MFTITKQEMFSISIYVKHFLTSTGIDIWNERETNLKTLNLSLSPKRKSRNAQSL